MSPYLKKYIFSVKLQVDKNLKKHLTPVCKKSKILYETMYYSLFAGGKRLRPVLVFMGADYRGSKQNPRDIAAAAEMLHTYTLIHDDLPSMDDDNYRRGKLSNHKKFGEDMAILAGDALLTHSFSVMAASNFPSAVKIKVIGLLSAALGPLGVIHGQVLDIQNTGKKTKPPVLKKIHENKTSVFIEACLQAGGLCAGLKEADLKVLKKYGQKIGLAFQVIDDILDVEGDFKKIGKNVNSDKAKGKLTYADIYGLKKSRSYAKRLITESKKIIKNSKCAKKEIFYDLADYIIQRAG